MAEISDSWRRLWGRRITRRRLMAGTALGAAGLATAAVLGCKDDGGGDGDGNGGGLDSLSISNWPYYIDGDTVADFQDESGISVSYTQDINDNNEFFAKIREPLSRGKSIGRDIIVLTDWMAGRLIRLGYVDELNKENIPNWVNLREDLKNVAFDPGRKYSLVWQSGLTGIGYNPKLTGRELKSVNDIFDPAFAGHVTMLTEMRDTLGLVMAGMGIDPANCTVDDARKAVEKIQPFVDNGHIRAFTGNEYGDDLARGDVWAAFAWSGDVVQLKADNPDLQLLLPEEGFMLWSDNMMIPKKAAHKEAAEQFMNYVYDPAHQAQIEAYVNYVAPVVGTKEAIVEIDPALAENPLIFPDEAALAKAHIFKPLTEDEDREFNELFQALIGV
ncbi:MAG: spermidine/putrescine transporter substrate-binding protein [Dehalococcoidia bacterium]|nr:spermidine/putrescine transporter substrate-binding protein [Dehalococcoidia bacterium]